MCPGGPPLGPGARVTGRLGFGAASDTSFCTFTPFPAVPGFVLVGLLLLSTTTSEKKKKRKKVKLYGFEQCVHNKLFTSVYPAVSPP